MYALLCYLYFQHMLVSKDLDTLERGIAMKYQKFIINTKCQKSLNLLEFFFSMQMPKRSLLESKGEYA